MTAWIDFKALRGSLDFEQVLRHYGIEVIDLTTFAMAAICFVVSAGTIVICASPGSLFLAVTAAPTAEGTNQDGNRDQQDEETQCPSAVAESAVESKPGMTVAEDDEISGVH